MAAESPNPPPPLSLDECEPTDSGPRKFKPNNYTWATTAAWAAILVGFGVGGRLYKEINDPYRPGEPIPRVSDGYVLKQSAFAGLLLGFGIGALYCWIPTEQFKERVRHLNPFPGRPRAEVVGILGEPVAVEHDDAGREHLTWNAPLYTLTLVFRDGACERVAREASRVG